MDDATANNVLARLEQLERENKLLKQWAARLKERLDKPPEPKPAGMSRGQRALNWGMVVGLVFLGLNAMYFHLQFDSMTAWVSTRELHIVNEVGDIGISLNNSKEHGPRLFMSDVNGERKIAMGVTKNRNPCLFLYRTADKPQPIGEGPPVGVFIGVSKEEHPQVTLKGPAGESGIYLGTKPNPTLEISGEDGESLIRLP